MLHKRLRKTAEDSIIDKTAGADLIRRQVEPGSIGYRLVSQRGKENGYEAVFEERKREAVGPHCK